MMISPEGYYEMYLKGKTEQEIRSAIRGLKNEIGHLKNIIEHPEYGKEPMIHPSEAVRISCTREYLNRAKQALADAGGIYSPSKSEIKTMDFQENIPHIKELIFSIGGFFSGNTTYTVEISNGHVNLKKESFFTEIDVLPPWMDEDEEPMTPEAFLGGIERLYLGEWRSTYSPKRFGYMILDGTQWELEVRYDNDRKPFVVYGDNSYPYNFKEFLALLGIEHEMEDDGDESE